MSQATPFPLPERFWAKTRRDPSGCLVWTAAKNNGGYGCYGFDGRTQLAHRVSYMAAHGEIPEGMHVDHLCRVKLCVEPSHLEAVTPRENNVRAVPFRGDGHVGQRFRFVTHRWLDEVNGPVSLTHRDYPFWRASCRRCNPAA